MGTLVGTPLSVYEASNADATVSGTYETAVEIGDVVLVFLGGYHSTATVSSITSTLVAGGFSLVGSFLRASGSAPFTFLVAYLGVVTTEGTLIVNTTMSASYGDKALRIYVDRGIDTVTPLLATNGATGTDQSAETGSIVTDRDADIIAGVQEFTWAASHQQNTGTPATGWTEWGDTATGADNKYQRLSAGTYNGNFTWTATDNDHCSIVVALQDASIVAPSALLATNNGRFLHGNSGRMLRAA